MAAAPAPDAAWYVEMIIRLIRFLRCTGQSGVIEMIAEQFGFAMMPLCVKIASRLISGTTSGTPASMRNADELSTITVPAFTAAGANFFEVPLPAENKPMWTPAKLASVSSCTGSVLAAELQRLAGRARRREQLELLERKLAPLEAFEQLDADGAGSAHDRNDGIRDLASRTCADSEN